MTFFGSHPPSPLFLQHHSCRTGTPDPGGHTHRVSPFSDLSFCPCSGCLTCDCQFFQQLADRILPNRPRNSFLFTGQPVEGIRYTVPDQYVLLGEYCTGTSTVPVFGTVRSCMNVLRGGIIEGECSGTEFPFADRSCRPLPDLPQLFLPSISISTLTK